MEFIDKHGQPVSEEDYFRLWSDGEYRRVGSDIVDRQHVSTVWLGIPHGKDASGADLMFETMIFGSGQYDGQTFRWATLRQAEEGHKVVVESIWNESKPKKIEKKVGKRHNPVQRLGFSVMKGFRRG